MGKIELLSDAFYLMMLKYKEQTRILQKVEELLPEWGNERSLRLKPLLTAANSNTRAIYLLATRGFINECFIISRGLIERIITFNYLHISDKVDYENYLDFTKQKEVRKLNRKVEYGNKRLEIKWTGAYNLENDPNIREALDKYTSIHGKEKTRWTNKTLLYMANEIEKYLDNKPHFLIPISYIYEDASEALHGTLYGAEFHMGMHKPENIKKLYQMAEKERKNIDITNDIEEYEIEVKFTGISLLINMITGCSMRSTLLFLVEIGFKSLSELFDDSDRCYLAMLKPKRSPH